MKKLLLNLLVISTIVGVYTSGAIGISIVDYNAAHKDSIIELSFQDPELFFPGYKMIPHESRAQVDELNKKEMLAACDEPLKCKKILIGDAQNVLGFAIYFKSREQSLESVKHTMTQQVGTVPFSDEQILAINPHLKRTDAECVEFILIEGIAIDKNVRHKGYGKTLLKYALEDIQKIYPSMTVRLNVDKDNAVARTLYESEGFVTCEAQPMVFMDIVQYEKQLK